MKSYQLLRLQSRLLGVRFKAQLEAVTLALKFSPDQPRDEQGRWTDGGETETSNPSSPISVEAIASQAEKLQLAARSDAYNTCLDLCYPLLERFQPRWSDRNENDFHRCMALCLTKTKR